MPNRLSPLSFTLSRAVTSVDRAPALGRRVDGVIALRIRDIAGLIRSAL
jgi:hypothetical protein